MIKKLNLHFNKPTNVSFKGNTGKLKLYRSPRNHFGVNISSAGVSGTIENSNPARVEIDLARYLDHEYQVTIARENA